MKQEIKEKIAKIYELVNRGTTEGERAAAKHQLDKLMNKYNLSDEALTSIHLTKYQFKYTSMIEFKIMIQIFRMHTIYVQSNITQGIKCLYNRLTYIDYVTANCMYEYFRRHSKAQWIKFSKAELARCRKAKTKSKRRAELQEYFIGNYLYKSKLYTEGQLEEIEVKSQKEIKALKALSSVEGGVYNQQLHSNLLLENQ